jgi:hypothetical protein
VNSEEARPPAVVAQARDTASAVDEYLAGEDLASALPAVDTLVAAAARLFTACSEAQLDPVLSADSLSPTEALTLVGALLRTHNINAFDLALWLSHTEPRASSTNGPSALEER